MATRVSFDGRNVIEPGAYAAMKYGGTVPVTNVAEFGNVLVINTLPESQHYSNFLTSGFNQRSKNNKIHEFRSLNEWRLKNFGMKGEVDAIAEKLFSPAVGGRGVNKMFYVNMSNTEKWGYPSEIIISDSGGLDIELSDESIDVWIYGNTDYSQKFYENLKLVFRVTSDGSQIYFDLFLRDNKIYETEKCNDVVSLMKSCNSDPVMSSIFRFGFEEYSLDNYPESFNGKYSNNVEKDEVEFTSLKDYTISTQPASNFNIDVISELDINFILIIGDSDPTSPNSMSNKIFSAIKSKEFKFDPIMFVTGKDDSSVSLDTQNDPVKYAKYFNSGNVVVVSGKPNHQFDIRSDSMIFKTEILAASIIGQIAGGAPQTPITFKNTGFRSFETPDLGKRKREELLQAGVLHVRNLGGDYVVNQGITSLQNNNNTYNENGESIEISVELIKSQVKKELIIEAEKRFIGKTVSQASPESVKNFVESKLASFVSSAGNDNLIISWRNVKVEARNSDYHVYYEFVPNVPVNKAFFVGNVLDFAVSI